MVLDIERPQPALLTHGERYEIADFHEFWLAEMVVQARPQRIVGRQVPGNGFGIGERRLLALVIAVAFLKIDQIEIIVLDKALLGSLNRTLISTICSSDLP